jgi:hypothetical protein
MKYEFLSKKNLKVGGRKKNDPPYDMICSELSANHFGMSYKLKTD